MVAQNPKPTIQAGLAALGLVKASVGFSSTALYALQNGKLTYSASAGAMTIAVKTLSDTDPSALHPVWFAQGLKVPQPIAITDPLSIVIPSGATVGSNSATYPYRLYVVIFEPDGNGVCSLGVICCSQPSPVRIYPLAAVGRADTTAIGTGSDSAGVFYTTAAVFDYQYRVLGFADFNTPPQGNWNDPDSWVLHGQGMPLPGQTIQVVEGAALASSGTTGIPYDNTIPQDTEGDEYFSNTIVPLFSPNFIKNEIFIQGSNSDAASLVNAAALFRSDDSSTDAIGVAWGVQSAVDVPMTISGRFIHPARSVQSKSFSLRIGGGTVGSSAFTLNGIDGTGKYGAALTSYLSTSEIMG